MPPKRKAGYEDDELISVKESTPSKDKSNRRTVKAPKELLGTPSKGGSSSEGGRLRKKQRKEKYHRQMKALNEDYVKWAKKTEQDIVKLLENKTATPQDFTEEVKQYIQYASEIKGECFPPTGDVLSFGTNEFGQIGQNEEICERYRPSLINTLRNRNVTQVACGGLHNISVTEAGQVDSWGCNDEGSLGCVGHDTVYAPIVVKGFIPSKYEKARDLKQVKYTWSDLRNARGFDDPKTNMSPKYEEVIKAVGAGDCQSLALSDTGRVYFFGAYKDKEGKAWRDVPPKDDPRIHPDEKKRRRVPPTGTQDWPIHVWQLNGEAMQISCGFSFNAAVVKNTVNGVERRECHTWGIGECGELARPVFMPIKKSPEFCDALPEDAGPFDSFNVDKVTSDYVVPKPALFADGLSSRIVLKVACGGYHIMVVGKDTEDGMHTLYTSGLNNYGQLGHGTDKDGKLKDLDRLTKVEYFSGIEIEKIAAGEHHSLCLDNNGTGLYAFGRSCSGELGHVKEVPAPGSFEATPVKVSLEYDRHGEPKGNPNISNISCGGHHCFTQTTSGDVYSWGYAFSGALGVGAVEDDCVTLPMKMDVVKGVNKLRQKDTDNSKAPVKASVLMVAGGGQHSALVAKVQEV